MAAWIESFERFAEAEMAEDDYVEAQLMGAGLESFAERLAKITGNSAYLLPEPATMSDNGA